MSICAATISVVPKLPIKGIKYYGQYGTSGYATAAKGYLYHYFTNGLPISWEPLYFDNSILSDDDQYDVVVNSLINKPLDDYDVVILHSTPDLWPQFRRNNQGNFKNKVINGYCTWETSKLPVEWVKCINESVNEVWCPSTYNEQVFIDSGITIPIRVVPHIFMPQIMPERKNVKLLNSIDNSVIKGDEGYTFYTIGEWNARKGIDDIITAFCKAFGRGDKVKLLLKVHYRNYTSANKQRCRDYVADVLALFPNHPPVICLLDNMSSKEILALHSLGDCYISLSKSEGFGLPIFDAFNYGKKIICTGAGGQIDYLGKDYPGLVKYKMGTVEGMESFSANYTSEQDNIQEWFIPNLKHVVKLMRKTVTIYDKRVCI